MTISFPLRSAKLHAHNGECSDCFVQRLHVFIYFQLQGLFEEEHGEAPEEYLS
jgi:hypothetical protein